MTRPPPYWPKDNGVIERFMRSMGSYIAVMMNGVDARLHCYGAEYIGIACAENAVTVGTHPAHASPTKSRYPRFNRYSLSKPAPLPCQIITDFEGLRVFEIM